MACDIQETNTDGPLWPPNTMKEKSGKFYFSVSTFYLEEYQIFLLIIVTIIFTTSGFLCVFKEAFKC